MSYVSSNGHASVSTLGPLAKFLLGKATGLGDYFTALDIASPALSQLGAVAAPKIASGGSAMQVLLARMRAEQLRKAQALVAATKPVAVNVVRPTITTMPVIRPATTTSRDPYTDPSGPPTRTPGWQWNGSRWVMQDFSAQPVAYPQAYSGGAGPSSGPPTMSTMPALQPYNGSGAAPVAEVGDVSDLAVQSAGMFGNINPMLLLAAGIGFFLLNQKKGRH